MVREINGDAIGVLFVENREITLADIRSQMMEDIEEFLPKNFHFMSVWGVPMSSVQEKKSTIKHALDEEGYLVIKPSNISANMPETAGTSRESVNEDEECHNEIPPSHTTNDYESDKIITPSRPKKAKQQSTLTAYFGATSNAAQTYTAASARKGVHVFREDEIEEAKGMEKKRKTFWNKKAEEICKDVSFDGCKTDEIDKLLHEKWKLHKASLLEEEDREVTGKIDEILTKCADITSKLSSSRKIKSETIARNLKRIADAKKAVENSRQGLNELLSQGSKQEKIKDKKLLHRVHYKELQKAEDAFRQSLEIKKKFLSELIEKS